jgi:hypothetical protein
MAPKRPQRRPHGRLPLVLATSLALHALAWWITGRLPERPPPPRPRSSDRVTISVRAPDDAEKPTPAPDKPAAKPKPQAQKPIRREPQPDAPKPDVKPPDAPVASDAAPIVEKPPPIATDQPGPTAPPGPPAAPKAPDLGRLRLFDPAAIGRAIPQSTPGLRVDDHLQLGGDDPESTTAQAARIQARLDDQIADAMGQAAVQSGFTSACDDGVDNNIDGEIDCADPGCRQLPLCHHTGVYGDDDPTGIPDGDGALVRTARVVQEGRLRKISLSLDVMHASPGDLELTLVAPDGRKARVRRADPSDYTFKKAYYVRAFNGMSPDGEWRLVIEDKRGGTRGVLRRWRLFLTS